MSSGYIIIPLADIITNDEEAAVWERKGLSVPEQWVGGMPLTPDGLRSVLGHWDGCTLSERPHGQDLHLFLMATGETEPTHAHTQTTITDYARDHADESAGHWLRFSYGSPDFLVAVAERLSQTFGPLLLVDDVGVALLVTPGTTADAEWIDL